MMNFKKNQNNAVCSMDCKNCHNGASQPNPMDDPMKDYYDLRYEETDGENHFVEETAYQEKQSEHSKMEDPLMEMVGGTESNVWKLYESIMCVYFDMEEIIKQAVYLQGAYDRERMLK